MNAIELEQMKKKIESIEKEIVHMKFDKGEREQICMNGNGTI